MRGSKGLAKGRWFDYNDQRERFEARELAQLRARKQNLTKYAAGELAEVARARDEELRARLEKLAARRWTLLLETPSLATEIRTLEAGITTSYRSRLNSHAPARQPFASASAASDAAEARASIVAAAAGVANAQDEPGHIARSAFVDLVTQSGKVNRAAAQEVFEGFAAMQHLRCGVIVFELDDLDAREIVAAAQLCHAKRGSARRRLRSDLFDIYAPNFLEKRDYEALLTIGVGNADQLRELLSVIDPAWRQGASLADRVKGRISRDDFTKVLRENLAELFGQSQMTQQEAPKAKLLCAWERYFLPKALAEKIFLDRRARLVENRHARFRQHRFAARLHRSWNVWRRFVAQRRKLRAVLVPFVACWATRALRSTLHTWSSVIVAEIMVVRAQRFARRALLRIRSERRAAHARAASRIQLAWRGCVAREVFAVAKARRQHAARVLQRFWRARVEAYAIKIALFRSLQSEWQRTRLEACIRIQAMYRMRLAKLRAISKRQARALERRAQRRGRGSYM